ncbi:MAG: hypothetical protein O2913_14335 [Chloroflexi bacterium]|nr:hypothetical protein [Chloroflexota bacterium]
MTFTGEDQKLEHMLKDVLMRIPSEYQDKFPYVEVYEGSSQWGAHVEAPNTVILDGVKLGSDTYGVAVGTIAHELAHVFLRHPVTGG